MSITELIYIELITYDKFCAQPQLLCVMNLIPLKRPIPVAYSTLPLHKKYIYIASNL